MRHTRGVDRRRVATSTRTRSRAAGLLIALALAASGCVDARSDAQVRAEEGALAAPPDTELPAPDGLRQVLLTRDGDDVTQWERTNEGYLATAPAENVGSNTRTVLVPQGMPSVDHGGCVAPTHEGLPTQQGILLRLRSLDGRLTGVSVTKNIWAGVDWIYNVTVWDSTLDPPFRKLAAFDMTESITSAGPVTPGEEPQLCARVRGSTFELKVWPRGTGEPPWGDPRATRSVVLPDRWVYEGRPGWYLGHLPPGGWARYESATTWVEPPA